ELPIRRRSTLPGVEAGAGDAEHPAEQRDRVVGLLRRDEPEAAHRVSLSRAKKAAAFFRISRSCSSIRTLRRSSRSSARSSVVRPSRLPASTAACAVHTRSVSVEIPRSPATSFRERPLLRYSATASRRNSGGYGFLKFDPLGMADDPSCQAGRCRPSAQMSTKAGAFQWLVLIADDTSGYDPVRVRPSPSEDQDLALRRPRLRQRRHLALQANRLRRQRQSHNPDRRERQANEN